MFHLWYNNVNSIFRTSRRKENRMFWFCIILLVVLLVAFPVTSKIKESSSSRKTDAFHYFMQIVARWKKCAYVVSDETITCTLAFGKLSVVYPPYGNELDEGECTEEVFVELMHQFISHDYPVDVSTVDTHYFIVHMPQKKSAN